MKKTVTVEYVGIEDVQEIVDDAYALMKEGHYVNVSISNVSEMTMVRVGIMLGGFDTNKGRDYDFDFYMSDDEIDVNCMNECKNTLRNLLVEVDKDYESIV